jgi:hypothetical protein
MSEVKRRSGREPTNPCELSAGGKGGQPKADHIDCLPGGVKVRGQPEGGALVVKEAEAPDADKI